MSGIDLLFASAIGYERTHQLALFTLLKNSNLPDALCRRPNPMEVKWEPEGQLFDLALIYSSGQLPIEIKMWASLTDSQLERQTLFLTANNLSSVYVLLGTSWFERDEEDLRQKTNNRAVRVGYVELLNALDGVLTTRGQAPDVYELALCYRNALHRQYEELIKAVEGKDREGKMYFYSLYWRIKQRTSERFSIYTVNNPGGEVYILNDSEGWHQAKIRDTECEVYFELVNGRMCIKVHPETDDPSIRDYVRNRARQVIHQHLDVRYTLYDKGRLGAYMTACELDHDFKDLVLLDRSAAILTDVHHTLPKIADAMTR